MKYFSAEIVRPKLPKNKYIQSWVIAEAKTYNKEIPSRCSSIFSLPIESHDSNSVPHVFPSDTCSVVSILALQVFSTSSRIFFFFTVLFKVSEQRWQGHKKSSDVLTNPGMFQNLQGFIPLKVTFHSR